MGILLRRYLRNLTSPIYYHVYVQILLFNSETYEKVIYNVNKNYINIKLNVGLSLLM